MRNNTSIDDMIANSPLFGDGDTPAELLADAEAEMTALTVENAALRRWVDRAGFLLRVAAADMQNTSDAAACREWAKQAPAIVASPASDGEGGEG
jgi:hypothetical protein